MKTRAFTLIELLVVIAIIALLMAIIMPALSLAKREIRRLVWHTSRLERQPDGQYANRSSRDE